MWKIFNGIFEKIVEYEPHDFAKVNTVGLIWQLFSLILITKLCLRLMLAYVWTPRFFVWKLKSITFFLFSTPWKYVQLLKKCWKSISSQPFSYAKIICQYRQNAYLIQNIWRYDSYRGQCRQKKILIKSFARV